ncbi:Hypothetical predicted protein [Octopus vulgaris]|uniref:Uncharacterized protein n=1 Tax=Octopus vulgaris TaxID=6645 RepID=A0AA36APA2_OCTVU|nr:Hypothetical predicted protein [Octopus vulgaris]
MQEGLKCRYHEDDSFSSKMWCFVALAFLPVDDVDGYEQLIDDDDIPINSIIFVFEVSLTIVSIIYMRIDACGDEMMVVMEKWRS